jgi:hypothetical protein
MKTRNRRRREVATCKGELLEERGEERVEETGQRGDEHHGVFVGPVDAGCWR